MKTAGDILSVLFDGRFMKKARGYSKFFDSWTDITAKNGIAAATDHSQIKDLDRGIVLIEIDHPGWKQVLQTKQSKLLNDFRIRFPDLDISGISFMLGSCKPQATQETGAALEAEPAYEAEDAKKPELAQETEITQKADTAAAAETETENYAKGYDAIRDEELREKLIRIGQIISADEKRRKQAINRRP